MLLFLLTKVIDIQFTKYNKLIQHMWYEKYNTINTFFPSRHAISRLLKYAIYDFVYLWFDPINSGPKINKFASGTNF